MLPMQNGKEVFLWKKICIIVSSFDGGGAEKVAIT